MKNASLFVSALVAGVVALSAMAQGQAGLSVAQVCTQIKAAKTADEIRTLAARHDKAAEIAATRKASVDRAELQNRMTAWVKAQGDRNKAWKEWTDLQTDMANKDSLKQVASEKKKALDMALNAEKALPEAEDRVKQPQLYGHKADEMADLRKKRDDLQALANTKANAQTEHTAADGRHQRALNPDPVKAARDSADKKADDRKKDVETEKSRLDGLARTLAALEIDQTMLERCAKAAQDALRDAATTVPPPGPTVPAGIGPILPNPANPPVPASETACGEINAARTVADVDGVHRRHHGTTTTGLQNARKFLADLRARRAPTDAAVTAAPADKREALINAGAQLQYQIVTFERAVKKWEDLDKALLDCANQRKAALTGPTFDELLASIEENLTEVEKIAPLVPAACTEILNGARQATAAADALGAEADALIAEANNAMSGGAGAAGAGQPMMNDATAALQLVTESRQRAQKSMQDTCTGSRLFDPADKGAQSMFDVIQRHAKDAEREVTTAANALQRIRNAHAAARAVQATSGTGVDPAALANRLNAAQGRLAGIGGVPAGLRAKVADIDRYFFRVLEIDRAIKRVTDAAPDSDLGRYAARNQARIGRIATREARLKSTADCRANLMRAIAELQAHHGAADAKLRQAVGPVAGARSIGGTAGVQQAIETIYNTARGIADQTAADAQAAIACAAKVKMAAPPPPPPPPPKDDKYYVDFSGTWKDVNGAVYVFSGNHTSLSVKVRWDGSHKGHYSEWSGSCQPQSTNVQKCTGQGVYEDPEKRAPYGITITCTMATRTTGSSHSMSCEVDRPPSAGMTMKVPGMQKYGELTRHDKRSISLSRPFGSAR